MHFCSPYQLFAKPMELDFRRHKETDFRVATGTLDSKILPSKRPHRLHYQPNTMVLILLLMCLETLAVLSPAFYHLEGDIAELLCFLIPKSWLEIPPRSFKRSVGSSRSVFFVHSSCRNILPEAVTGRRTQLERTTWRKVARFPST